MNIYIIEGIDGAGKSVASRAIKDIFPDKRVLLFREPCGVSREKLVEAVVNKRTLLPAEEYNIFWSGRFDLWANQIIPEIDNCVDRLSTVIVIDRSFASTFAYQIIGRGWMEFEQDFFSRKRQLINLFDNRDVEIHHIYLRVRVEVGLSRIGMRKSGQDDLTQFEQRDFLQRVKAGFDLFYGPENKRTFSPIEHIHIIDASGTKEEVLALIKKEISP